MKNKIFLSIVIPTFNSQNSILPLLNSINKSNLPSFNQIEVIVVDDGSTDDSLNITKQAIKNFKFQIKNYALQHRGPAYTRNFGVDKSLGQYILFLDSDVILKSKTLSYIFDFFKNKKGRAATGVWDKHQKTKKFFPQFKAYRDYAYWFAERELGSRYYLFSTRIAAIEKKLFQKIGGFDTSFKRPTVEDIDLTYKIEKYAKISFEPEMMVSHEFEDFWPLAKKYFARSRDWIKLYMKRLRFDPVATSRREANKSIVVGLFAFFILIFLASLLILPHRGINLWLLNSIFHIPLFLGFSFFFIFLGMEFNFLTYLYYEKDFTFTLLAIPTSIILYLIIDAGSAIGLIEYLFRGRKK